MDELWWAEGAAIDDASGRALFESLIEAMPMAAMLYERSGRLLAVNRCYRELFHRLPPAGLNILEDPVSHRVGADALFRRALAGETASTPDVWYDLGEREGHATPRRLYLRMSVLPIRDATGAVGHVVALIRDLTDIQRERDDIQRERDHLSREVAEHEQVTGALRASEANLVTAQRINRIGSWELDLVDLEHFDRNPVRWSEETYRVYGLDPARVTPGVDTFMSLVHPDDLERTQGDLGRVLESTGTFEFDTRIRRGDSAERIIHGEAMVERDADGRPTKIVGTVQDVTEERLDEAVLRESEERLQMALTAGRMVAWEIDVPTGRLFVSRNAGEVLGLLPGQSLEHIRDVAELIHPDDRAEIARALVTAGAGGGIADVAARVTRPIDGRVIWIQGRSQPPSPQGAMIRLRGLAIDITAQKRLDDALRISEFRYRTLVERAPEGIVVLDLAAGHFVEANASALRMFGRTREDLYRLGPQHVSPPVQPDGRPSEDAARGYLTEALEGKTPTFEWTHRDAAGRDIACEIRLVRMPAEGRMLVRGSILDISARKRLDEMRARSAELEVQNRRIREASRLKSEFLANMSHELRTPLNAIIGFAELLHDGQVPVDAPQFREFLGDILTSGRHLLQLINDVLDLSKVEAGKTQFRAEPIDLERLIGEVVAILRTTAARRRVTVVVDVDDDLDDLRLDPARLKQVLYNYLSNALKFTEAGGRVAVRARGAGEGRLRLEVEDSGVGISAADLGRLFVEFQQLDPSHRQQGTGLGLALTRRLVEAQGGSVAVVSTPGVGSTFTAVLPRRFGGEVTRRARATTGSPVAVQRVLVVEDDPGDQQRVTGALAAAGYDVVVASTAAEALALGQARGFDAATIDLILPDASGLALIRDLRALARDLPIVVITAVPDDELTAMGVEVLEKPIDPVQLIDALSRAGLSAGVASSGSTPGRES